METSSPLLMFFYGTLMRGQSNHVRFCRRAVRVEPATTFGRLYELPSGFPGLHLDAANVCAVGTRDYLADAQRRSESAPLLSPGWDLVHGELFTFDDPEQRLVAIDALEGYEPGEDSLYERVAHTRSRGARRDPSRVGLQAQETRRRLPAGRELAGINRRGDSRNAPTRPPLRSPRG